MTDTLTVQSIPHRPPFLFVDDIVEVDDGHIVTTKYVDPSADFFRGHYPGEPVMPGVLVSECCFQAGALLIAHRMGGYDASRGVPVLTRITDAKFRRIVKPGSTLRIEVTLDDELDNAYYLTGRASVEGKAVLRVQFVCMQTQRGESSS